MQVENSENLAKTKDGIYIDATAEIVIKQVISFYS